MSGEGGHAPGDHGAPLRLGPIAQVSLLVHDVDAAVTFYRDVLGLPHLFTVGGLAFHDIHGVRLYLHRAAEGEWRPGSIVYFSVDDIWATEGGLQAAGARVTGAPHRVYTDASGVEEWMMFFEDPDGNTLAATARVAPQ